MTFPAPPLETVTTGSISTEGDRIAVRRHQNRQIGLTLEVLEPGPYGALANLAPNPSFEAGLTGWDSAGVTPGTFEASSEWSSGGGDQSLHVIGSTPVNTNYVGVETDSTGAYAIAATAGETYSVRAAVNVVEGADYQAMRVSWYTGGGSLISSATDVTFTGVAGETTVASPALVAPPTTAVVSVLIFGQRTSASTGFEAYVDSVAVMNGGGADYFDGDTPGCAWTGTPHASTSTRPASGGPRFRSIIADVEAKVAKVTARGGTLRWTNDDGDTFTFDLLAADQYDVPMDIAYFTGPVAQITTNLVALPYARKPERALTAQAADSPVLDFVETGIEGDVPALGRLVIDNPSGEDQHVVHWGLAVEHTYPWALVEAAATTLDSGTSTTTADSFHTNVVSIGISGTDQSVFTHDTDRLGEYRVLARVKPPLAAIALTLRWGAYGTTLHEGITTAVEGGTTWRLADLGVVHLEEPLPGLGATHDFTVRARGTSGTAYFDWLLFIPVELGGKVSGNFAVLPDDDALEIRHDGIAMYDSSLVAYKRPGLYEGDYLRIPVGGPVSFVVKASRKSLRDGEDLGIDDITAQVHVTERFLSIR